MIQQTKTKLFKICSILLAVLCLQFAHAQTINLTVKSVDFIMEDAGLFGTNCGNNDAGGGNQPDPRIWFRTKNSSSASWSTEFSNIDITGNGPSGVACGTAMQQLTNGIIPAADYTINNISINDKISVQVRGLEADGFLAGGNDASCGFEDPEFGVLTDEINIISIAPCDFSSNQTSTIQCETDGGLPLDVGDITERYSARWQWKWSWNAASLTNANSAGSIDLSTPSDATICIGGDPAIINSTASPRDPIPNTSNIENIQWQVNSPQTLNLWVDIGSANGLTYNPPILGTAGTYKYRRKVQFCTGDLLGVPINKDVLSNEITIIVVADPSAPSATKIPNTASVCLGTTLTLSTPQYGTNPGKSCGFEYQTSTDGTTWSPAIPQTTIPSFVTTTGSTNYIRQRVQACTNGCGFSQWAIYSWDVISDTAAPTINGELNVCTGQQTTLIANAPAASTVRWYSNAALTQFVNTGVSYMPTINSDTSFWVTQQQGGCISRATRVNITALPSPGAPTLTADDQSICSGQSTMLNSNVLSTVFYRDDSRTSRLGSGTSVSTGNLAFTTTFYAADTSSASCPGILAAITIDVAPAPDVANVLDETICAGDSILLSGGTATTEWYLDAALTDTLHIGSTYQTTALTTTTKYYLQVPSSCGTAYDSVTVNVNPIPPAPEASDVEVCNGLSSSISLDNTEPGAIVTWYDDAALENAVQVGSVLITPILTEDKTYYVTQTVLGCVSPASSFNVTIIPSSSAPVISADPAAICFGDASTLTSNSEATIWYSDAGQTRIGTGGSIDVMPTNTTTYYAQDTAIGCSALSSVTVKISEILPAPEVENVTVCKGGDVSITGGNSGTVWYSDAGITQVGTGATLTLTNVQATATYYARNEGSTCQSELDDFVVNVTTVATPSASGTTVCSGQSASITATGIANAAFTWYNDVALENSIQEGAMLNTPVLTSNTTYYVTQTVDGCESDATEVVITVTPSGNAPIVSADPTVICNEDAATLTSNSEATIWYSDAGQTRIGTGGSIDVMPTSTTTYYAQDTTIGCSALSSVTVQVSNVLPTPEIENVTVCKGGDLSITGGNSGTVWYSDAGITQVGTGATLTLTNVQATATYYARNEGSTCQSELDDFVVNVTTVATPSASGTTVCSGQSASITATGIANAAFTWYNDVALENSIQEGAMLNTPVLTSNTTYYVTQTVDGCESDATEVVITVTPSGNAPIVSADPTVICNEDAATLTSNSEATIWYSDAGQTRIGTGGSIDVMPTSTTTYYAQDTTIGCSALSSVTVQVSNVLPTPEIENVTVCKNGDVTITGGNSGTVWYSDAGITQVGTGATLTLTNVQATATYYARNEGSTCQSELDDFVVNVTTVATPSASGTTVCSGQSASITATGIANAAFTWYNDAALENSIQEGAMLNTPALTSNTTYYVTQTVGGCESDATTVVINVTTPATAPILTADPTEICTGQTSELTSSAGANTVWYSDAGITQVGTGATFTTPEILSTTTFYARDETNSNCPSLFGSVTINVTENVDAPIVQGTTICSGTSVILTGGNSNTVWYDNPALYIPALTTGTTYTTPILNTNTTYYLRNENGDCVSDVIEVLVTVVPTPVAPQITGNQPVCEGESITLTANCGGNEARWYNSNDELVSIGVSLVLNNPIDGASYYATCKNGNCESTASRPVTIVVNEKPQLVDYLGQYFYPACPGEETEAYFDVSNLSDDEVVYVYSDINMTDASYIDFADNIFDFAVIDDYLLYQSRTFYYEVVNLETGCNSEVGSFFIEVVQPTQVVTAEADPTCVGEPVTVRIANYDFIGNVVIYDYDGRNVGEATINDVSGVTEVEIPALGNSGYYNYYIIEYGDIFCTSIPATFIVNVLPAAADVTTINDTICVGEVATLTATSNDPITWYSDATLLNAVGTGNTLVIPGLTTTKNYYAVSSNGTCKSSSEMATVVVNSLPAKPVVYSNSPVCEGASINLTTTATGNVTYNWTGPNGYTSNVQNPQIASAVKATHQGIYTLTITDNVTGCTSMASSVQVDINPGIQAPTASNNGPVCEGTNAVVSASTVAGAIYAWSGPNGFTSSLQTNNITNITTAAAGDYSVSIYKDGCWSSTATTTLVVNAKPVVSVDDNSPLCEHQTLNITSSTTSTVQTYVWTGPNGYTNNTSSVTIQDVNEADNQGAYTLTITDNNGCKSDVTSVWVVVNKYPDNIISLNNGPKCEGNDIQLDATNVFGASYSWTGPNGFTSNVRNPVIENVTTANSGAYTLVVTLDGSGDNDCNSAPVSTEVVVYANPVADAGQDDTTYQDKPLVLNGSGGATYLWSTGEYLSTTNIPNPVFISSAVGNVTKTLTVWDAATGCSDDDDVVITVLANTSNLGIPDLITPNGDGINDVWYINLDETYVINVYARGGALVMSTSNYGQNWSGTYKDKQLPDGAYWYAIELSNGVVYKGTLTIKR